MKGLFITLEGPDGSGKSTQIALLKDFLEQLGYEVVVTRDPGGTDISEQIRGIILDRRNQAMNSMTELLLYASSRAQLVGEVIKPAVESGKVVICDRFVDSSLVYQGMARGLGTDLVYDVNRYAVQNMMPDVTFFLDLPAEEGIRRKNDQKELDRMELEKTEFHQKVAEGYQKLAKEDAKRIVRIDAMLSVDEIHKQMTEEVKIRLMQ